MTVNYTTNLSLGQPVTGTESGTWGDDVNNAVTSYLDIAIAGGLAVTVTTADVTLTITQGTSVATNIGSTTAQYAILNVSGAMTAARNLILPSSSRQYVINNACTGGFLLTVKGSATTGVTLVNGEKAHVFWTGTDYSKLSNTPGGAGTFSSITNTGLTSGRVVFSTSGGLETDSAGLTFDGTNFATTGTATAAKLIPTGNSATGNGLYLPAANSVGLSTNGTNAVYIDSSQNVGIGTSSPSTKLHVAGASAIARIDRTADASANPELQLTAVARQFNAGVGGATFATAAIQGSYYLYDATAGNYRFVLNSSGNVGIGTDTGSVGSGRLNVVGGRSFFAPASETYAVGVRFISTGGAYYFGASDGTATPDGVFSQAGGSERMRITNAGNVGIGNSSPTAKLDVTGGISLSGQLLAGTSGSVYSPIVSAAYVSGTSNLYMRNLSGVNRIDSYNDPITATYPFQLNASTMAFQIADSTKMTLASSGNVGIGTTSPAAKLDVNGVVACATNSSGSLPTATSGLAIAQNYGGGSPGAAEIDFFFNDSTYVGDNGGFRFYQRTGASTAQEMLRLTQNTVIAYTGGTERARIDSNGNLLVGITSAGARFQVQGAGATSATYCASLLDSGGFPLFDVRNDGLISTGSRSASPYNNTSASVANVFVDSSGILYRSTSSLKYKTNVQDATHGLTEVMALRPVTYKGKSETDGDTVFGGLIAEEVHAAGLTEFVQYAEDGSPDALAYGNMVSLCIKAIQEQQALITSLTARITALESKEIL